MNIFDTIENNAIKNKYINNTAVTQITSANKIKAFSYKELIDQSTKVSQLLLKLSLIHI